MLCMFLVYMAGINRTASSFLGVLSILLDTGVVINKRHMGLFGMFFTSSTSRGCFSSILAFSVVSTSCLRK